jgi:hypothetical protein
MTESGSRNSSNSAQSLLIVNEYFDTASPTGKIVVDLMTFAQSRGATVSKFHGIGRYTPGGTRPIRLFNLCYMHLFFPFVILFQKSKAFLFGRNLKVIVTTSPPLLHWTVTLFSTLFCTNFTIWFMDAHPHLESLFLKERGLSLGSKVLDSLNKLFTRLYRKVVTLDRAMMELIRKDASSQKIQFLIAPPWSTFAGSGEPLKSVNLNDSKIRIVYAGNYGAAHDLESFFSDVSSLPNDVQQRLNFTFVGMGASSFKNIEQFSARTACKVYYVGRLESFADVVKLIKDHDLGIVNLGYKFTGYACPSKVFTYVSLGVPILYVGGDETLASDLAKEGWGYQHRDFIDILAGKRQDSRLNCAGKVFPNNSERIKSSILQFLAI